MCNGVWECPGGTDELKMDCPRTTCPGMFQCRNCSICIAMDSTCDGENDCPSKDENLCSDYTYDCPPNCSCLFYSMSCKTITQNITENLKSYISIKLDQVMISSGSDIFNRLDQPIILILGHCKIISICLQSKFFVYLRTLDVSHNLIQKLDKSCFKYARNLYLLRVSRNQVKTIQSHAFNSSQLIRELDLSSNILTELHENTFSGLLKLQILDISGNGIFSVSASVFLNTNISKILTESFVICCSIKPLMHTVCPIKLSWPNSCKSLLGDSIVAVCVWFISTLGIFMNIFSYFAIWRGLLQSAHNYKTLVILLAVSDSMCCISLLIIVIANTVFEDNFLQYEYYWRSNLFCYASSSLSLIANFLSVFTINLLALTRYRVAVCPLDSRFLEQKFLGLFCVLGTALMIILGVSINVVFMLNTERKQLPTGLCLIIGHTEQFTVSKITTIIIIVIQSVSCISIPVLYWLLLMKVGSSKEGIIDSFEHKEDGNVKKSILVSITNLLSWIPSNILLRLTLAWDNYPYVILIWTSMVIIPLNTLINPMVFVYFKLIRTVFEKCKIKTS